MLEDGNSFRMKVLVAAFEDFEDWRAHNIRKRGPGKKETVLMYIGNPLNPLNPRNIVIKHLKEW